VSMLSLYVCSSLLATIVLATCVCVPPGAVINIRLYWVRTIPITGVAQFYPWVLITHLLGNFGWFPPRHSGVITCS